MSYISDCRTDEYYNEKYLNKKDKEFIRGFDCAVEMAVDNFFANNFIKGIDDSDFIGHEMLQEVPESEKEEYTFEWAFSDSESEERKVETIADYIRFKILEYCEQERNELITSMIDEMSDEEYNAIKEKVDKS